ncbi:AMP-binding protein [Alcaligenaceae bacterium]|nr:AMP-binding protein [Alcaligenaceae bacterium]
MPEPQITRPWLDITPAPAHGAIPFTARHTDVLSMFHHALDGAADKPAIHYFDKSISYAELNDYANKFALKLLELGVKKGDRVALYMQGIPQFVICAVGLWKVGAIGVTINPMNRTRELKQLLHDSKSRAIVLQNGLYNSVAQAVLSELQHDVTPIVTSAREFQSRNDSRAINTDDDVPCEGVLRLADILQTDRSTSDISVMLRSAQPSDPAMLVYTSGTTGTPKAAIITHENMATDALLYRAWMGINDGTAILGMAPLFHITGLIGHVAFALASASALILTSRFHPEVLAEAADEYKPEFVIGAFTAFIALMNNDRIKVSQFQSLKQVYTGGASVPAVIAAQFEQKFGLPIRNCYGLTESTGLALAVPSHVATAVDDQGICAVGIPVFATDAYIAGDDGSVLPPGEVGEIMLRGPQVVPGYWANPEQTQEMRKDGYLKTGDVGYMNAQGWFFLVDRKKDMIVASGYKVWPKEVEDVIYSHPAIMEASVIGVPDDYRGETVKAVISLKPNSELTEAELISFCKERLAAYKYPRIVEILDELPKTATGKIMRRMLR